MTLAETFECFKLDHPDSQIGKSKFAEKRPQHVMLTSKMPHNVCGCVYHSNVILLLEALHRKYPEIVPLYSKLDFLGLCVCDLESECCMSDNCYLCGNLNLFRDKIVNKVPEPEEQLRWYQWEQDRDNYTSKLLKIGTVKEALENLGSKLPQFTWHVFIKSKQEEAYKRAKNCANQANSETCLLQMDFAENFTCVWQDEIQSAHWRQKQVTVYTVMVYFQQRTLSWVIVSDCRDHEKNAVAAYTSKVLEMIKDIIPDAKQVDVWTDGPSSQYKNKYIFALRLQLKNKYQLKLGWNYFATSHGKGPNDALGGNVKRIVHRQIMGRAAVVSSAETFAECVRGIAGKMTVVVVNKEEIDQRCLDLEVDVLWDKLPALPGTINTHCVRLNDETICCSFYTSSETPGQIYRIPGFEAVKVGMITDRMETDAVTVREVKSTGLGLETSTSNNTENEPFEKQQCDMKIRKCGEKELVFVKQATRKLNLEISETTKPRSVQSSGKRSYPKKLVKTQSNQKKWVCSRCKFFYGDPKDPKQAEDWLKCVSCEEWLHESCAENFGIIDDSDLFTCSSCL